MAQAAAPGRAAGVRPFRQDSLQASLWPDDWLRKVSILKCRFDAKDLFRNYLPRSMNCFFWVASSPMRIRRNARRTTRSSYFLAGPKRRKCRRIERLCAGRSATFPYALIPLGCRVAASAGVGRASVWASVFGRASPRSPGRKPAAPAGSGQGRTAAWQFARSVKLQRRTEPEGGPIRSFSRRRGRLATAKCRSDCRGMPGRLLGWSLCPAGSAPRRALAEIRASVRLCAVRVGCDDAFARACGAISPFGAALGHRAVGILHGPASSTPG